MTDGGATVSMLGRASVQRPCFIVQIDKKGQGFRSFSAIQCHVRAAEEPEMVDQNRRVCFTRIREDCTMEENIEKMQKYLGKSRNPGK